MSKKDCIMKGYDIEATNALLSNGMVEDIDDDVSSINLKKEESFVHMQDEHTYNPLVTAGSLKVEDVVYDDSNNHRLRVIDVKDGNNSWTKTITWKDLEDNRIFTTNPGINALFELKVEGDKEFEVDDDIDFEFHPIDTYFENFTEDMDSVTNEEIRLDIVNSAIDALHDMGYDDDFIGDYVHIEVKDTEDGRIKIEVRGEFNYEELSELSDRLNKVVSKYDKYAYFDMEDSGIASAYILKDQSDYVVSEEVVKAFAELIDACETREDLKKVYIEHIRPSVENDVINTATLDEILDIFDKKLDALVADETKLDESKSIKESTRYAYPDTEFTIKSSGYDVNGKIIDVEYKEVENEHYTTCKLDCRVNLTGKVREFNAEGVYGGTGDVQSVPIVCKHVYIKVPKGTLEDWKVINSNNEINKTALLDLIIKDLGNASCSFDESYATYDGEITPYRGLEGVSYYMRASIYLSNEEDIKKVVRMARGDIYTIRYDVIDKDGNVTKSFEGDYSAIQYAIINKCLRVDRVSVTTYWDGSEDVRYDDTVWDWETHLKKMGFKKMDEKLSTSTKTFSQWFDETQRHDSDEFYPFSNYAKTFESAAVLKDATAMDIVKNAHKFYDVYPVDSSDREKAFLFASKELGIKYDDLYDAWLSDTPVKLDKYESINESRGNDEVKNMTNIELAKKIADATEWNEADILELVKRAGLEDEYEAADGDTFESVIYKAAEVLGVEI